MRPILASLHTFASYSRSGDNPHMPQLIPPMPPQPPAGFERPMSVAAAMETGTVSHREDQVAHQLLGFLRLVVVDQSAAVAPLAAR
jgi:hypothetical protein